MSPFKVGDRVVVHIPEPVVGVVRCLTAGGDVVVDAGSTSAEVAVDWVRPAAPRDQADIALSEWWWFDGAVVFVDVGTWGLRFLRVHARNEERVRADDPRWAGPVARPPEVRS